MDAAAEIGADVVCLQETRHHAGGARWAAARLIKEGWRSHWSVPPPPGPLHSLSPGGTSIFWKHSLGRSSPLPSSDHRLCGRRFAFGTISSIYGPASRADVGWLTNTLHSIEESSPSWHVCIGDYNWRPPYNVVATAGWSSAAAIPTTANGHTSPTRGLALRTGVEVSGTQHLLGIPHHLGVAYHISCSPARQPPLQRLRRTAVYEWNGSPSATECHCLQAAADSVTLQDASAPLGRQWTAWHRRAEATFVQAAALGLATVERPAERCKGSAPSTRNADRGPRHHREEAVPLRRLRRLHRALTEECRRHDSLSHALSPSLARRHQQAFLDNLVPDSGQPPRTLSEALDFVNAGVTHWTRCARAQEHAAWKRRFAVWSNAVFAAAKPVLHPADLPPTFSSSDMAETWRQHWAPANDHGSNWARNWIQAAADSDSAGCPAPEWQPPSRESFVEAMTTCKGSAGLDGWHSQELRALAKFAPWLCEELYNLWVATTNAASSGQHEDLLDHLYSWRVVGIPKKHSNDSRPIAVGSCLVRAWHRTLTKQLPATPTEQWCGKQGLSATQATAHWWQSAGTAGAEMDLAKAFDSVAIQVADAALEHHGTPRALRSLLVRAWRAPRYCCVMGELASPIIPTCGLPPGDPCVPNTFGLVLSPWHGLLRKRTPDVSSWAYMDDRSLRGACQTAVQRAIDITQKFDDSIGLLENMQKRQIWEGKQQVEHLGLRIAPGDACLTPTPRADWEPVAALVSRLHSVPGSAAARERLVGAFVKPLFTWAAPLCEPPPAMFGPCIWRAIIRSNCSWWCQGRWWCDRILLHPCFGSAVSAILAAPRVALWKGEGVQKSLQDHASILGLQVISWNSHGLWLRPAANADPRVLAAANQARPPEADTQNRPHGALVFNANSQAGAHAIRIAARVRALALVRTSRQDAEGIADVDLEAQSDPSWTAWSRRLHDGDRQLLSIWRGGAVRSPTRRWSFHDRTGESGAAACPWCQAPFASSRHFWTECPRFAGARVALEREFDVSPDWWRTQPRCTAKSGWITLSAGPSVRRRAQLQVASCRLGLVIVAACAADAGAV